MSAAEKKDQVALFPVKNDGKIVGGQDENEDIFPEDMEQVRYKCKDSLLLKVYSQAGISQATLAESLGIANTSLSTILKRLEGMKAPPVRHVKAGKFKFYFLTEYGQRYVEENLLGEQGRNYTREIKELWSLLQSQAPAGQKDEVYKLIDSRNTVDNAEGAFEALFIEFRERFQLLYCESEEVALGLLDNLVQDDKFKSMFLEYLERNVSGSRNIQGLSGLLKQDCELAYHFIDDLFEKCILGGDELRASEYGFGSTGDFLNMVHELEAFVLHMLLRHSDKWETAKALSASKKLDQQFSFYIAEKMRGVEKALERSIK